MKQVTLKQVHKTLLETRKTIAVAESCTGGLTSSLLTSLSGSSKYFILGVVTYSNKAKTRILGIPTSFINKNGVVSCEVAVKMAKNICKIAKTDFGIGITGIAGPTGGTAKNPIGTVFIAVDGQKKNICKKCNFTGNRTAVRRKAALKALQLLYSILTCAPSSP